MTTAELSRSDLSEHPEQRPQAADAISEDANGRRRPAPYAHLFRLLHWVLPVTIVMGAVTGLSLHAAARPEWSLLGGVLPNWLPGGQMHVLHLLAAVVTTASLAAVVYLYWRRKTRRRAIHVLLLIAGAVLVVTGLLMIHSPGPAWVYLLVRWLHAAAGLGVLSLALLWHLVEALVRFPRLLIRTFHPWASPSWRQLVAFAVLLVLAACLILNVVPNGIAGRQLVAKRIASAGQDLATLPWDEAQPLVIELANGSGFEQGRTKVTLQALHDGQDILVRARWADPTHDRRYQPWRRTDSGWEHMATVLSDESYYYEDKLSLVFPTQPNRTFETVGCAVCCHVGGGRPYGYKGYDSTIDVWHWKATRTDPVGQLDDKYWSDVELGVTNGRHGDPKTGGGYETNVSEDESHPKCLPATPAAVRQGGILSEQAVAYESAEAAEILAQMPAGTIVPGMLLAPFEGDRGDVGCQSSYRDGQWEVLIRRRLDTGSEHDVQFVPGRTHTFGCAAFDHSSKRHAYNLASYGLRLEL
jgi:hypothetical protein